MYSFALKFDALRPLHREFLRFVQGVETNAARYLDSQPKASRFIEDDSIVHIDPKFHSAVWDASMSLTAFMSTEFYDAKGTLLHAPPKDAASCAMVIEAKTLWDANDKTGVRWNVTQAKFYDTEPDPVSFF